MTCILSSNLSNVCFKLKHKGWNNKSIPATHCETEHTQETRILSTCWIKQTEKETFVGII